jgi:N-acetylglucosaminyl-diphospho-decaprenol L-rhamnosyltransferase
VKCAAIRREGIAALMESGTELHVLIVNWRTADLAIQCIGSLASERQSVRLRAIVIDNASGDGSGERLNSAVAESGWQDWVEIIQAPHNGGFAYGNNIAIRRAIAAQPDLRYVLLLNPDTIVRPNALRALLDFMNAHPEAGCAGGISEDLDGTRQHCSFRFPSVVSEFASYLRLGLVDRLFSRWTVLAGMPLKPEMVDWVSGAHLIIRREVIDQIGLLDEGYFLYFEETDFILRAKLAGWSCWHVPASRVVHFVGKSSGFNDAHGGFKAQPDYWFESRRRYFVLNHGRLYACLTDLAVITGVSLCRIKRRLQRLPALDPPGFVRGLLRLGALRYGRSSLRPRITAL